MTVLEQLGEVLAGITDAPCAPATVEQIGIHVLDTVAAWIAGRNTDEGQRLAGLRSNGKAGVPLFTDNVPDRVALACATIRLTEIDDIHMPSCTTPSSVVVPVALYMARPAKGATRGATGRARKEATKGALQPANFAAALLAGYEAMTRFGAAIDGAHMVYRGVWPTYFTAPMGAAAVAARMFGLDGSQTANALGIALTTVSGTPGGPSAPSPRWLLLGWAARAGCSAALAAAEGYSCDRTLLDGDWLKRTHGIEFDTLKLQGKVSPEETIASLSFKPYCAAKQCTAAIEAFRELQRQGISADEITSLQVAVPPAYAAMIGHSDARNGRVPRITSVAYNIALAAYEPNQLFDVSRPDRTVNPAIARFIERIEIIADENLSAHYPQRWPAVATATLQNGQTRSATVIDAPGDRAKPFTISEVKAKFHRYADAPLGESAAADLANACLAIAHDESALQTLCEWS